jgi:hypothetical protein
MIDPLWVPELSPVSATSFFMFTQFVKLVMLYCGIFQFAARSRMTVNPHVMSFVFQFCNHCAKLLAKKRHPSKTKDAILPLQRRVAAKHGLLLVVYFHATLLHVCQ